MKLPRRQFLHLAAGAAALPALPRISAHADGHPSRPVRMLVGSTPGAAPDVVARLFGQWLAERLGQPIRGREPPRRRWQSRRRAGRARAADGYMLLVFRRQTRSTRRCSIRWNFNLAGRATSRAAGRRPDRSADAAPGQPVLPGRNAGRVHRLRQSQSGQGQYRHAAGRQSAIRQRRAARDDDGHETRRYSLSRWPRGCDRCDQRADRGRVGTVLLVMAQAKAGTLRPLAVTSTKRSELLPDVPAMAEILPGDQASQWIGIGAPRTHQPRSSISSTSR